MSTAPIDTVPRSYWFVGASWGEDGDQTSRFLEEGIWENGYEDKYLDEVRSMRPGEQIAIKSTYTRKHDLPFDNRGESVSVMAIKAIGTITENRNEGKRVRVDWTEDALRMNHVNGISIHIGNGLAGNPGRVEMRCVDSFRFRRKTAGYRSFP